MSLFLHPHNEPTSARKHKHVLGLLALSLWQKLLLTFLFALCVTIGLVILSFIFQDKSLRAWHDWSAWGYWFTRRFSFALFESYSVYLFFEITSRLIGMNRIQSWSRSLRLVYIFGIALCGVAFGWIFAVWVATDGFRNRFPEGEPVVPISAYMSLFLMFAFYFFWSTRYEKADAERRATEARLRLLQAQIEPHFLFNTLANVVSLIDYDAPKSKQMLETFIEYLRASIGSTRNERVELHEELALVEPYLKLLQIRMDNRLHYVIDVPAELRHVAIPPLTLQPLVENAIVHGLEPKIEGGTVHIKAEARDGQLVITVADDGIGLSQARNGRGNGVALNNIRERISGQFGNGASLTISPVSADGGTLATLVLPFYVRT